MDELKHALRCQAGYGANTCEECKYKNVDGGCNTKKIARDAIVYIKEMEDTINDIQRLCKRLL